MALAGDPFAVNRVPVSFPQWNDALAAAALPPEIKASHEREVIAFLRHCKTRHAPATVMLAKQYVEAGPGQGSNRSREALRWFFRAARIAGTAGDKRPTATMSVPSRVAPPPFAREDRGGADWERDLIAAVRRKNFLWRTEQTYREWAARFAEFVRPRSPYAATGDDVAAFLSRLAVEQRASAATQKQALNALVFFMQEALRRALGEMDFRRARAEARSHTSIPP